MSIRRSLLLSLPVLVWNGWHSILWYRTFVSISQPSVLLSLLITNVFFGLIFYLMLRTRETDRFRFALLVIAGVSLLLTNYDFSLMARGTTALRREDLFSGGVPTCSLAIPSFLVGFAWDRTIIFPSSILGGVASVSMAVSLFLLALFTIGRGWCSWFCYYGSVDSLFSNLLRRPVIRNVNPRWALFPFAVLVAAVIVSPITYMAWYCRWLCPLKPITEFEALTDGNSAIRFGVSLALLVFGVVLLSILTKKRTLCGYLCPLGALFSLFSRITPFSVRIRKERCKGCRQCIDICPTSSVTDQSLKMGRLGISCTLCGKCVDHCESKALVYHVAGTKVGSHQELKRYLWLLVAYGFGLSIFFESVAHALFTVSQFLLNRGAP